MPLPGFPQSAALVQRLQPGPRCRCRLRSKNGGVPAQWLLALPAARYARAVPGAPPTRCVHHAGHGHGHGHSDRVSAFRAALRPQGVASARARPGPGRGLIAPRWPVPACRCLRHPCSAVRLGHCHPVADCARVGARRVRRAVIRRAHSPNPARHRRCARRGCDHRGCCVHPVRHVRRCEVGGLALAQFLHHSDLIRSLLPAPHLHQFPT